MEENSLPDRSRKKLKKAGLTLPQTSHVESSPLSSPYFKKLPPLSPRSMKLIDPRYKPTESSIAKTDAMEISNQGISGSTESTASSNGFDFISSNEDSGNVFDFQPRPSGEIDTNANDIDFFIQVVSAFHDYLNDQVQSLEQLYSNNQKLQLTLQKAKKEVSEQAAKEESQLSRDVAHLVTVLHQKQMELKLVLREKNEDILKHYRGQEERCRKNIKLISELLSFAKSQQNISEGSLKRSSIQQIKERLTYIQNLSFENLHETTQPARINLDHVKKIVSNLSFLSNQEQGSSFPISVYAPRSSEDITTSSITVRWQCLTNMSCTIYWKYLFKGKIVEKLTSNLIENKYTITDLPSNCDVIVKVRPQQESEAWSEVARFKTLEAPAFFVFDGASAHVKLKLSKDKRRVFYNGSQSSSPKSPSRFSFALNVLGSQAFFTGKHYWEVKVNESGWACGAAYQGVPRNSWFGSNAESWILHHNPEKFNYKARHGGEAYEVDLNLSPPNTTLEKLGIYLDVEGGIISFVDPLQKRIIFSYTQNDFIEPVCAAVNPFYHGESLMLITGLSVPEYLQVEF